MSLETAGLAWRKSSFSNGGGMCVELSWRTSSFSNNGSICVEVAQDTQAVYVRDSKNVSQDDSGPRLSFDQVAFTALLTNLSKA